MKSDSRILPLVLILIFAACQAGRVGAVGPGEEEWVQLFNGKDLSGWDLKFTGFEVNDNYRNTFRVEDGLLSVSYDEWEEFNGEFGHIFYKEPYSYYRLRVEYRFVGEQVPGGPGWAFRNNGLMLHSQPAPSMELDQDFPISIELQLLGGDGKNERSNANLCTPGTNVVMDGELVTEHCIQSTSRTYHGEHWVTVEALVLGSELVQHILHGEVVLEYTEPQIGGGVVSGYDPALKQDGRVLSAAFRPIVSSPRGFALPDRSTQPTHPPRRRTDGSPDVSRPSDSSISLTVPTEMVSAICSSTQRSVFSNGAKRRGWM